MNTDTIRTHLPDRMHTRLLPGARLLPYEDTRWSILHADSQCYAPLVPLPQRRNARENQADLSCEQAGGQEQISWYNYVRPFQWYRSEAAIRAELKRWSDGEHHPLEAACWQSPWGRLISIAMLDDHSPPRVFSASSERTGGVMLEHEYARKALSAQALAYGEFWQGNEGWPIFWCASYNIELTIIRYEHPEWCLLERPQEILQQEARQEIDLLFPEYFASGEHFSANQKNETI